MTSRTTFVGLMIREGSLPLTPGNLSHSEGVVNYKCRRDKGTTQAVESHFIPTPPSTDKMISAAFAGSLSAKLRGSSRDVISALNPTCPGLPKRAI